jgi:Protein of unknown function (DUF3300)
MSKVVSRWRKETVMKSAITLQPFKLFITLIFVLCLGLIPLQATAEDGTYTDASERFSEAELAQLLAPIALYPDALLTQILMASTYPIEVIEADRWLGNNPGLSGDALDEALLDREWDPSVKALCHFPSLLAQMSERIGETTDLGNAFLAQEGEVMAMAQKLRAEAYAQGHLFTSSQQTVLVQSGIIIIEPANPAVIYVPYYDPSYVYGTWWYPAYPPYYWGPARLSLGVGIHYWPGTYFSFTFGSWSYFDWQHHDIHIDVHLRPRFVRHDHWIVGSDRWRHIPQHRRGVAYHNRDTARKYGQTDRHNSSIRHDVNRHPERIDQNHNAGRRDRRQLRAGKEQPRVERTRPGNTRQVQQRATTVQRSRARSQQAVRDRANLGSRRQVQTPPTGNRQVRERSVQKRQNRAILNRNLQGQNRVEPTPQIHKHPRLEQQQQATTVYRRPERKRPESARQISKRQQRNGAVSHPQKQHATRIQPQQVRDTRFSKRLNDDQGQRLTSERERSDSADRQRRSGETSRGALRNRRW